MTRAEVGPLARLFSRHKRLMRELCNIKLKYSAQWDERGYTKALNERLIMIRRELKACDAELLAGIQKADMLNKLGPFTGRTNSKTPNESNTPKRKDGTPI